MNMKMNNYKIKSQILKIKKKNIKNKSINYNNQNKFKKKKTIQNRKIRNNTKIYKININNSLIKLLSMKNLHKIIL